MRNEEKKDVMYDITWRIKRTNQILQILLMLVTIVEGSFIPSFLHMEGDSAFSCLDYLIFKDVTGDTFLCMVRSL